MSVDSISSKKSDMRAELIALRKSLSNQHRSQSSNNICTRLDDYLQTISYEAQSHTIAIYYPMAYEVDLHSFILQHQNSSFALPVVLDKRHMEFVKVAASVLLRDTNSLPDFLRTPAKRSQLPNEFPLVDASDLFALVLPGLGFDIKGMRLGYGGSFYDTYLNTHHNKLHHAKRIALAFDEQVCSNIPCDSHDEPVDCLITASQTITF